MLSYLVKFWTDGQTERQTDTGKTKCPRFFDAGAKYKTLSLNVDPLL